VPTGQSDSELSVLADPAVDLDRAAVLLGYDVVADGEAQTGSFSGGLRREERLKEFVFDLGSNSSAIVTNADFNSIPEIPRRHLQSRLEIRIASVPLVFGGRIEAVAE
jgi:hypothetical protein